jgi:WD40 repeat protein
MIESVSFSPDGKILATGGDDGTVRLWSVPAPGSNAVRLMATEHDSGSYVFSVAFSSDGQTLAAASADGLTRLWSVRDPAPGLLTWCEIRCEVVLEIELGPSRFPRSRA